MWLRLPRPLIRPLRPSPRLLRLRRLLPPLRARASFELRACRACHGIIQSLRTSSYSAAAFSARDLACRAFAEADAASAAAFFAQLAPGWRSEPRRHGRTLECRRSACVNEPKSRKLQWRRDKRRCSRSALMPSSSLLLRPPALCGALRHMSRVGRNPVKVPPSVTVSIEPMPSELLFPFRPFSKKREKYALRNRPSYDSFQAFGAPTRVKVEGPLGELALPIHSFCSIEATEGSLLVKPQCGGTTKLGKTLWGTTRGYLSNAVRGVSQGFTKELELHGVGFRARVEPSETAAPPAGEAVVTYRLGTQKKYGESPFHKQAGPVELPDLSRGGALIAGAGGGYRRKRHALRPKVAMEGGGGGGEGTGTGAYAEMMAPGGGSMLAMVPGILNGRYGRPGGVPQLQLRPVAPGGQTLMMRLGFTHEVRVDFPAHLEVSCPTPTTIIISGIDRQQVGLAASRVRLLRKPDPYKEGYTVYGREDPIEGGQAQVSNSRDERSAERFDFRAVFVGSGTVLFSQRPPFSCTRATHDSLRTHTSSRSTTLHIPLDRPPNSPLSL